MEDVMMSYERGRVDGENRILKQIVEQLLKINLTPKLSNYMLSESNNALEGEAAQW